MSEKKLISRVLCSDFEILGQIMRALVDARYAFAVNYQNEDVAVLLLTKEGYNYVEQWTDREKLGRETPPDKKDREE